MEDRSFEESLLGKYMDMEKRLRELEMERKALLDLLAGMEKRMETTARQLMFEDVAVAETVAEAIVKGIVEPIVELLEKMTDRLTEVSASVNELRTWFEFEGKNKALLCRFNEKGYCRRFYWAKKPKEFKTICLEGNYYPEAGGFICVTCARFEKQRGI
jgi:hypothetical protein